MSIPAGMHRLGPDNATLSVRTGRSGAAAKAGHDLVMHVTAWEGLLEVAEDPASTRVELSADATSLRVHKGTGGIQALGDEEKAGIHKTIDDDVLKREEIAFRSTRARSGDTGLSVEGDLTLVGKTRPIAFELSAGDDGRLDATAVVTQSAFGIKPYSALFGTLKVADDVEVVLEGQI